MQTIKNLAIIPARGGSKGIPRKNIRILGNKPLIAYTIQAALQAKKIDRVIVSTEDEEIETISQNYGAEIIKRPVELAEDNSSPIDVIIHVIDTLKGKIRQEPELIVLLQPTSPFRTSSDIDKAIELFDPSICESIVSICECKKTPFKTLVIENNYLTPFIDVKHMHASRQTLPTVYYPNGAIYISPPQILREKGTFHVEASIPYLMPQERSLDIDTETDLMVAELYLESVFN